MSIYHEHNAAKKAYEDAKSVYKGIMDEKAELFARTQPSSVKASEKVAGGGAKRTPFDDYLVAVERAEIDRRIGEAKNIMLERRALLQTLEADLRASKIREDKVYLLRYVECWKVQRIARYMHYSEAQIYRILAFVLESLNDATK